MKKKLCTYQRIVIMEGGHENMEADVTTKQDDKSIKMESDQFIEEQSEPNFEQVINQGPLPN
jgi:hypothetical protein